MAGWRGHPSWRRLRSLEYFAKIALWDRINEIKITLENLRLKQKRFFQKSILSSRKNLNGNMKNSGREKPVLFFVRSAVLFIMINPGIIICVIKKILNAPSA